MKPPSTVEARVAEELRNWLSSELEQLDASNTNQFAHHVVTILLHEDLDIEDEPLTAGDDFLQDIYSMRRGKTRDNQKKAAVQFLRRAVCCTDSGEAEIQGVVDELMVKIEETKIKMNTKASPKRNLLAPISVNVENSHQLPQVKSDSIDQERLYDEAFPSLHSNSNTRTIWHRLQQAGKENSRDIPKCKQHLELTHKIHSFISEEEVQAWNIVWQVFISALPDTFLPAFEAAQVLPSEERDTSSCASFSESCQCWSICSAFQACTLMKKFIPTTAALTAVSQSSSRSRYARDFCPTLISVLNQSDLHSVHLDPSYEKTLTDHPQLFRPIKETSKCRTSPLSELDMEVERIFSISQHRKQQQQQQQQSRRQVVKHDLSQLGATYECGGVDLETGFFDDTDLQDDDDDDGDDDDDDDDNDDVLSGFILDLLEDNDNNQDVGGDGSKCVQLHVAVDVTDRERSESSHPEQMFTWSVSEDGRFKTWNTEIDEVLSFPHHHGSFWKLLTDAGCVCLYPVLSNQVKFELENAEGRFHQRLGMSHCATNHAASGDAGQQNNVSHILATAVSAGNVGSLSCPDVARRQRVLESACIEVRCYYALQQIAHLQQEHKFCLQNLFMPSLLNSCLSQEDSQFLQKAFVNTYFSNLSKESVIKAQARVAGMRCSDLEHSWLSTKIPLTGGFEQVEAELVPGCTCSGWLENSCHLGDSCPFSHPSLQQQQGQLHSSPRNKHHPS